MAEDGCYIVALSSMEHGQCPADPCYVRGEGGGSHEGRAIHRE